MILTPLVLPGRTGNRVQTLLSRDIEERDGAGFEVEQAGITRVVVGKHVAAERLISWMRRMSEMGKAFRLGSSRPTAEEYRGDEETNHGPDSQPRERFQTTGHVFSPGSGIYWPKETVATFPRRSAVPCFRSGCPMRQYGLFLGTAPGGIPIPSLAVSTTDAHLR